MLSAKEQMLDKDKLEILLKEREDALKIIKSIKFDDKMKTEIRKKGTEDEYKVQVVDKPSDFRKLLESIGVSNSAKNEVIKKVKAGNDELTRDIKMLEVLIS
jgi:S-adenosylmethionine:tRNA-ribosyltransferase-isomerase (queuine synthetase)